MKFTAKEVLVRTGLCAALALCISVLRGLFAAEEVHRVMLLLCDGFFSAGAFFLLAGGLVWSYNGGTMDGFTFSNRKLFSLRRRSFEENAEDFAEHRSKREKKKKSPLPLVISGGICLLISLLFLVLFNGTAAV